MLEHDDPFWYKFFTILGVVFLCLAALALILGLWDVIDGMIAFKSCFTALILTFIAMFGAMCST